MAPDTNTAEVEVQPPLPPEFRVNQASIDYLKMSIEAAVRDRFIKWIGVPFGTAGVLAVFVGVFWFLPGKMAEIVRTDPMISEQIRSAASDFLRPENDGGQFISSQINRHVTTEVSDYFTNRANQAQIATLIGDEVKRYFERDERTGQLLASFFSSEEGRMAVNRSLADKMQTPEVQQIVRDAVDRALEPTKAALLEGLGENLDLTVSALEGDAISPAGGELTKGSSFELQDKINEELRRQEGNPEPVCLSVTVSDQGWEYDAGVCHQYAVGLDGAFGDRFLGLLVLDRENRLLGYVRAERIVGAEGFRTLAMIVEAVNTREPTRARGTIGGMLPEAVLSIKESATLVNAIRDRAWSVAGGSDVPLAVTDEDGSFVGVTTRNRLLDAAVDRG